MVLGIAKNIVAHVTASVISPMSNNLIIGLKSGEIAFLYTGSFVKFSKSHSASVNVIVFTPDEKYMISGAVDGTIFKWNFLEKKKIGEYDRHSNRILSLCISKDGSRLISGSTGLKIYDFHKNKLLYAIKGQLPCRAVENLEMYKIVCLAGYYEVLMFNYEKEEYYISNHARYGDSIITSMALDQVEKKIIVGFHDGIIRILDEHFLELQTIQCRYLLPKVVSNTFGFAANFCNGFFCLWKRDVKKSYHRFVTREVHESDEDPIDQFTCTDSIWSYRSGSILYIDVYPREVTLGLYRSLGNQDFCDVDFILQK